MIALVFFSTLLAVAVMGCLAPIFISVTIHIEPLASLGAYLFWVMVFFLVFYRKYKKEAEQWEKDYDQDYKDFKVALETIKKLEETEEFFNE